MKNVIVITGASSGFGALTARALAGAGHIVYAGMRETTGRNAPQVKAAADYAREHSVDLRSVELDVASDASVDEGIASMEGGGSYNQTDAEGFLVSNPCACRHHKVSVATPPRDA